MNIHSERLRKGSKSLPLGGRQFVIATKFRKGQGGLKIPLNFFAYDGWFHDEAPLQFVEVRFDRWTIGHTLRLKSVNKPFSTIAAMIGGQHMAMVIQLRRRQFLDQMITEWIALLLPFPLEESRLSGGHAMDRTTLSQVPRLESSLAPR